MKRMNVSNTQMRHSHLVSSSVEMPSRPPLSDYSTKQALTRWYAWYLFPTPPCVFLFLTKFSIFHLLRFIRTLVKVSTTGTIVFSIKLASFIEKGEIHFRKLLFGTLLYRLHWRVYFGVKSWTLSGLVIKSKELL